MIVSKSYQNCTETEVPGYNDCPSFLFMPNRPSARRKQHRVISNHLSANDNPSTHPTNKTDTATAPPPILHRSPQGITKNQENVSDTSLSKEEILNKVGELYGLKSKLVTKEFEFYKKKVDNNLVGSLENGSTRAVMTRFFLEANSDRNKASNTLRAWMSSDVSVINWCPAFLKIFEHTEMS
ncbi:hypothetical protein ZYGR_0AN00540 [Zygosaccharomyces rouxii]|uniref:Uncharacterized protein n=1 Tax=Zygosaccharomyces rouxii TaxID=4956 RepID=A0A1Q3AFP2_ZYGRO|nr:hypothetical protein ZYGR_0AN00540 [Zygosaccharomyces rouxii]